MSDKRFKHPESGPRPTKLCGWFFEAFTCPNCGGHHFGSHSQQTPDKKEWIILSRQCHDEYGLGYRWEGSDVECMADEDTLPEEIEATRRLNDLRSASRPADSPSVSPTPAHTKATK